MLVLPEVEVEAAGVCGLTDVMVCGLRPDRVDARPDVGVILSGGNVDLDCLPSTGLPEPPPPEHIADRYSRVA